MFEFDETEEEWAAIKVIGVGARGCNVIDALIETGIERVELIAIDSDLHQLKRSKSPNKVRIGTELGEAVSIEERKMMDEILQLHAADMVFVVCDIVCATATGVASVVAKMAREVNVLTIGVVTTLVDGVSCQIKSKFIKEELAGAVDSLIVIENNRLSTKVMCQAIRAISTLIITTSYIGIDFADVKSIMSAGGIAKIGFGVAEDRTRASRAAQLAISNLLLEKIDISEAKGVLVNISGSSNMTMEEFDEASRIVHEQVDEDVEIIVGLVVNEALKGQLEVTVVTTGHGGFFTKCQ